MGMYQTGNIQIFDDVVVPAGGSAASMSLDLSQLRTDNATLQLEVTGDGTADFSYDLSNNGVDFMVADGVTNVIKASVTKTSGPASDGKILINFTFKLAEAMKITVEEKGAVNPVTVNGWLVTR